MCNSLLFVCVIRITSFLYQCCNNVRECSVKEVVCFGEGAGANILARFAVSLGGGFSILCLFSVQSVVHLLLKVSK